MKVRIGKYPQWIGPYQIAEKIIFWADKYDDDDPWARRQHKLGEWLAGGRGNHDNWVSKTCAWIHKIFQNAGERRVKIRIDDSDVWGADHTLALIIVPVLEKLKAQKNGGEWSHPMGNVRGNARSGSSPGGVGRTTASASAAWGAIGIR